MMITDVDRDGDRIALLRPSNSTQSTLIYANLSLSDDLGKTWQHVQVRREIARELGGDTHQIGVHLEGGKVYLLLSRDIGALRPVRGQPLRYVLRSRSGGAEAFLYDRAWAAQHTYVRRAARLSPGAASA